MATEIILPKVDMDMATGRISRWFFKEGDSVKKGDVVFEIETDKAAMEIDAPSSGILRNIAATEGIDIPVGSAVAWLYEEGESLTGAPAAAILVGASGAGASEGPASTTAPPMTAQGAKKDTNKINGRRATPLARRLARNAGIEISSVKGSGPNGRVTRADIEAYSFASVAGASAPAPAPAPQLPSTLQVAGDQTLQLFAEGSYDLVPHAKMRRTIASRLVLAKSTIPHFYLTTDCNVDALLTLRAELNASATVTDGRPDYRLSVNDFVIKAYSLALRAVPEANVSWTDDDMVRHHHADIGVAVSVPGGLITPIVRNAESKTLSTISKEIKDLVARARDGKLRNDEYQGGTAAVSNLGMFGVQEFAAIVNPPHATILAVGSGERRPIVNADDTLGVATLMRITLSTDHRAVDGALAAQLMSAFRTYVERPMSMLV